MSNEQVNKNKVAVKKIYMNKEVGDRVNVPRFRAKDGSIAPLYTRIDGGTADEYGNTNKPDGWEEKSKVNFGSPNNVKRVMITHRAVYVHLYAPVVYLDNNGNKAKNANQSLVREYAFSEDLKVVLDSLMSGRNNYIVKYTGLEGIVKPYVLSDVEEIYWDWSIYLSEDIDKMAGASMHGDMIRRLMNEKHAGMMGEQDDRLIRKIFAMTCCRGNNGNLVKIKNRFPRLRQFGYIENLEEIMRLLKSNSQVGKLQLLGDITPVKKAIEDSNENVCLVKVRKGVSNTSIVRSGTYIYDKIVLEDYFNTLNKSVVKEQKAENKEVKEKGEFEKTLDRINEINGEKALSICIKAAFAGNKGSIDKTILELTEEGKKKYERLIRAQSKKENSNI